MINLLNLCLPKRKIRIINIISVSVSLTGRKLYDRMQNDFRVKFAPLHVGPEALSIGIVHARNRLYMHACKADGKKTNRRSLARHGHDQAQDGIHSMCIRLIHSRMCSKEASIYA